MACWLRGNYMGPLPITPPAKVVNECRSVRDLCNGSRTGPMTCVSLLGHPRRTKKRSFIIESSSLIMREGHIHCRHTGSVHKITPAHASKGKQHLCNHQHPPSWRC